ncbi:hypothetical protein [Paenibacillus guangzhouensis]|uniref:hypothetical protein n=1 Tax=Paenibacillus guangzhouensis TaxID=1473112 RepID=UPI0012675E9E|nr:hypothetical protein [Paenibacillus guangzhouensis]
MKKRHVFLFLLIISIIWLARDHLNQSFGELTFRAFGMSPWSEGTQGLHIPNSIGLMVLLIGFIGVVNSYRTIYPKIFSRLLIGVILLFAAIPWVTEHVMYLAHYNAKDTGTIQVVTKDRRAYIERNEAGDVTIRSQEFKIYNYGQATRMKVIPLTHDTEWREVTFDPFELQVEPHTQATFDTTFKGTDVKGAAYSHDSLIDIQVISVE